MFTIQYKKTDGGSRLGSSDYNVTDATNETHNPAHDSVVSAREEKQKENAKPRTKGRRVSYGKIGLTTVAVTQDLI